MVSVHQFLVPQTQRDIYRKIIHATASAEVHVTSNEQKQAPASVLTAINPLKPELNPICYLLALLAHHFLHVSRIRVKSLTLR